MKRTWIFAVVAIAIAVTAFSTAYWLGAKNTSEPNITSNNANYANDGIKVTGDWTVTVFNSDGSLDSVNEFANKLHPVGTSLVTSILAGENEGRGVRDWDISFSIDGIPNASCAEDKSFFLENGYHKEDKAQVSRELSTGNPLLISKACTVVEWEDTPGTLSGQIDKVWTKLRNTGINYANPDENDHFSFWSPNDNILESARANRFKIFTEHWLSGNEKIDVKEGQFISFQVRIAFE